MAGGAGDAAGRVGPGVALEITYYTDPLCCWSWAIEPHLRRLREELGDRAAWRTRLGGMIPDWRSYQDPVNAVSRPVQMGPVWVEARILTGAEIDEHVWVADPPGSSYPASIAVKAAGLQSEAAAAAYLRRVREAVMTRRLNVARREVLLQLARELAASAPGLLDTERLERDLDSEAALDAMREDLRECRYRGIGRFPTLTAERLDTGRGVILVGYRPYEVLRDTLDRLLATA